jgi:hypothetical protein
MFILTKTQPPTCKSNLLFRSFMLVIDCGCSLEEISREKPPSGKPALQSLKLAISIGRFTLRKLRNFCLKLLHATCLQFELYCVSCVNQAPNSPVACDSFRQRRSQLDNWGGGAIFIYSCSQTLKSIDSKIN